MNSLELAFTSLLSSDGHYKGYFICKITALLIISKSFPQIFSLISLGLQNFTKKNISMEIKQFQTNNKQSIIVFTVNKSQGNINPSKVIL